MEKLAVVVTISSLFVGILLTIWGLVHLQWPQAIPWRDGYAIARFFGTLFTSAILVFIGAWWSKKNVLLVGAGVAIIYALLSGALWPLLVTVWFFIASTLLGFFVLTKLRVERVRQKFITSFLIGAGSYGTGVGLIAHFPVSYPGVYGLALVFPVILGWRLLVEEIKIFLRDAKNYNLSEDSINLLDVVIVSITLIYFIVALMPEFGADALAMHLFIPGYLEAQHQWGFDVVTYVWAAIPTMADWIYSIGFMLGGEAAARLINVGFIFILGWLIRDAVLWAGGSPVGARWAILIFLSTPLTYTEGITLYVESIWASFVVAGTLAVLNSCSSRGDPKVEMPVAGLLLGFGMATKAVTFTLLPMLLLLLVLRCRVWYKVTGLSVLWLSVGLFLGIGLIPYLTAWWLTGNPVFPWFNSRFHSSYYPSDTDFIDIYRMGISWNIFYQVTFQSGKYLEAMNGASGFQWLLLFIPSMVWLFFTKYRRVIALVVVGLTSIAICFHFSSYLRYVFPEWVLLTTVIGVGFSLLVSKKGLLRNMGCVLATVVVGLNLLFLSAGVVNWYPDFDLKSVLQGSNRYLYLEERAPIRSVVELINHLNTRRTPVVDFSQITAGAGLSSDVLYDNWYNVKFYNEVASAHTEQELLNVFLSRGVEFVILDTNFDVEKQELCKRISKKIGQYGSISVVKIKSNLNVEL